MEHVVEAPEQGLIEKPVVVGRSDDEAVRAVLLDELQERIENAAHFTHIVFKGAVSRDGIEFIEEIDARFVPDQVEDLPQLGAGLAHEFGDKLVHLDRVEGQAEFVGKNPGGHRLAGAGRAGEQEFPAVGHAVFFQFRLLPELMNHPLDAFFESLWNDEGGERQVAVLGEDQSGEVLGELEEGVAASRAARFIDDFPDVVSQGTVPLVRFVGCYLEGKRVEALVILAEVGADQGFDLFGGGHWVLAEGKWAGWSRRD